MTQKKIEQNRVEGIKATSPKGLLIDYGSEVMALVQKGKTEKLAQLTDKAYEELCQLFPQPFGGKAQIFARLCNPPGGEVQGFDWVMGREAMGWLRMMRTNSECKRIIWSILEQEGGALPQPFSASHLLGKVAKVQRCLRNCRVYPSLCRKYSKCKVAIDKEDYEWADQILALLPDIEEVRREREEWVKVCWDLLGYVIAAKNAECDGKVRQEREMMKDWVVNERKKLSRKKVRLAALKPDDTQTQIVIGSKMKGLQQVIDKLLAPKGSV